MARFISPAARREKIAQRILSLLRKTLAKSGCTEEEKIAAKEKARELVDRYRISRTDLLPTPPAHLRGPLH